MILKEVVVLSCLFIAVVQSLAGFALVCYVFLCFVTFPCGVLDQTWYLIVTIPDICLSLLCTYQMTHIASAAHPTQLKCARK